MSFSARQLVVRLQGELDGPDDVEVTSLAAPGPECRDALVVISDPAEAARVAEHRPAVIVGPAGLSRPPGARALIRVPEPRLALAALSLLFDDRPLPETGVHPYAAVSPDARLATGVRVAAGAIVGSGTEIGDGTIIGEGAVVGAGAVIGPGCRLHPRAVLQDGVRLGQRVIIHSGAVIGSDGFGYVPSPGGAAKLHHLGTVIIEDDVEVGANTTIDRATLGATVIGARSKIDNLCQIAHNVTIGPDCLIAGQCGVAGSTRIGRRVVLAGGVGVGDHLEIGDEAVLGPRAAVLKSVPAGERWLGYPAQPYKRFSRQSYLIGRLERIWSFVRQAEGNSS